MMKQGELNGKVPDTLDLADFGRLAINGLLGTTNPERKFTPYFLTYFDVHPAYMVHYSSMDSGVLPKYLEALPLMRLMSGSDDHSGLEEGVLESVIENISEDGMIYDRRSPDRPWNIGVGYGIKGWDEDYANMAGNGRLITALIYYYKATGDEEWKKRARRTVERMAELAVIKDDYGYYPNLGLGNDYSYPRESGWTHNREPASAQEGAEGAMLFYLLQPVRGWSRWYSLTGDEKYLDLSRKFVNFGMQHRWWGGLNDVEPFVGAERGHFWGHYHGMAAALRGLLDYAIAADDYRVKEFVRDGYEWARHHGIHRLGVFPKGGGDTEGCTVADMVGLAVALTDAGMGEYWEDVDQYSRNQLLGVMAWDKEEMERVSQAGPERPPEADWGGDGDTRFKGLGGVLPGQETSDRVIERSVGAFGHTIGAKALRPRLMHCCTGNGSQALYYAWEGALRRKGEMAEVNLWMNRRSPWADVWSWLPYEGKLIVQNKGLDQVAVRIPGWTSRSRIRCTVNGSDMEPGWMGNRAVFRGLKPGDEIVLETPVVTEKTRYAMANLNGRVKGGPAQYDCEFRGNTVICTGKNAPSAGGHEPNYYRLYRREHMRAAKAPMKEMPAYVHPEKIIQW